MKRFLTGGATLAVLLMMATILGPKPFHLPLQNPPRIANFPRDHRDLQDNKVKGMHTRAEIAAQDMAVTTALCVRDCRFALQHLANQLDHTTDPVMRNRLLQDTVKEHPQFRSIVLHAQGGQQTQRGTVVKSDKIKESLDGVKKTGQFYVTDLYDGTGSKQQLLMSIALPLLHNSKPVGTLAAEVEMGYLRAVADHVDGEMGTHTVLQNHDGNPVLLHPEKPSTINQTNKVQRGVDGTKWKASSTSVGTEQRIKPAARPLNEVVVQFHSEPTATKLDQIKRDINGEILRKNHLPSYVFRSNTMNTGQLITYFKKLGVKMVEPNHRLRKNDTPNDQLYQRYQWNFPKIKMENAWQFTTGAPGSIIGVVDTGVDLEHPEFQGQLVPGHNVIADTDTPQDDNGHGTHVSGVVAARTNNIEGVAGMNWTSKIMPVKAMDADGSGSVFDIADGIRWAVDHGAKVINLSLGQYEDSNYLHDAIKYATSKDVLVVAAMGNDNTDQASYPAAYSEVLAVCAVDENGQRAEFSNYGNHAGVSAPGVSIASTFPDHRYAALSGTSMASPHVAGLAGLIRAINPNLSASQVKDVIMKTATDIGPDGKDPYYGSGLINVSNAVQRAQNYGPSKRLSPDRRPAPVNNRPWWWPFRWIFS